MPFNIPTPASPLGQPAAFKPPAPPKPGRATGEAFTANKSFYNKGYGAAKTALALPSVGGLARGGAKLLGRGAVGATKGLARAGWAAAPIAIPAGMGMYQSLQPQKTASIIHPAVDIAGLGLLAARPLQHLLHSKNQEAVRDAKWELAGLGTLAVPSVYDIGKLLYHNLSLSR